VQSPETKIIKAEQVVVADKAVSKTEIQTIVEPVANVVALETEVVREVLAKETKYGIAKEYGISVKS
jgi:hypothetical protein